MFRNVLINRVSGLLNLKKARFKSRVVFPQKVSKIREIPSTIDKPLYVTSYKKYQEENAILHRKKKNKQDIENLRKSCQTARKILIELGSLVRPGLTTEQLDEKAHELCLINKVYPSPLLYKGFPKSICTSVNNVACHGIPDDRQLSRGDLINIDVTVYQNGFHGDCSHTYLVTDPDDPEKHKEAKELLWVGQKCLNEAIKICRPGQKFSQIGYVISRVAAEHGVNVIPDICGHGIADFFHGPPNIYHYENNFDDVMQQGMTFTIEPVLTFGGPEIKILDDNWTVVTIDDQATVQFEHTILIREKGVEVLTI